MFQYLHSLITRDETRSGPGRKRPALSFVRRPVENGRRFVWATAGSNGRRYPLPTVTLLASPTSQAGRRGPPCGTLRPTRSGAQRATAEADRKYAAGG